MPDQSSLMLNLSVLYRSTQKYFDRVLARYGIGYGQLLFLIFINEHEGCTMQEATRMTSMDKGTTSKSIGRLMDQGYVQMRTDEKDHRIRRLYTTEKATEPMNTIYEHRNEWRAILSRGTDFRTFENLLEQVKENAMNLEQDLPADYHALRIGGLQKLTLLDYPDKTACTIFTAGCDFKCPFCHNRDLVFLPEDYQYFDPDEIMAYLKKRKGLLDGVCISGGEPLMQDESDLIDEIHRMGYLIKLDTNGSYPEALKKITADGKVDYVAMDLKNSPEKYAQTCGMNGDHFPIEAVRQSVSFLLEGHVNYEFRTTVVKEFHTEEDIRKMGEWIRGADRWVLQQFEDSGTLIQEGLHGCSASEMETYRRIGSEYVSECDLRGVREE